MRAIAVDVIDWSSPIRPIDPAHVERLAGAAQLPPIKVWKLHEGRYRGIDGYHRWHVAKDRGERTVDVSVYEFPKGDGGEREFELECVKSNLEHGLPLTREQRDQAIIRIWHRWGTRRSDGENITLEQLARLFNLTKPRIHQIVTSVGASKQVDKPREAHPGGFSSLGRFSSATRRISTLLTDKEFIDKLLVEQQPDVFRALTELRALIETVLAQKDYHGPVTRTSTSRGG